MRLINALGIKNRQDNRYVVKKRYKERDISYATRRQNIMGGRVADRIPLKVKSTFSCENKIYSGTVTNLSEKGMFIRVKKTCCKLDQKFGVSLPLEHEKVHVTVKPVRIVSIAKCFEGIGVELIDPPEEYLDFVYNLIAVL
jgi:hypothetical protein